MSAFAQPGFNAHTALKTFEHSVAPLLKGLSIAKVAPVILLVFIAFIVLKTFLQGFNSKYTPYARSLALTAANLWDSRDQLGLSPNLSGRTAASMESLTEVLDALSNTVRKYEYDSIDALPSSHSGSHSNFNNKVRFE